MKMMSSARFQKKFLGANESNRMSGPSGLPGESKLGKSGLKVLNLLLLKMFDEF